MESCSSEYKKRESLSNFTESYLTERKVLEHETKNRNLNNKATQFESPRNSGQRRGGRRQLFRVSRKLETEIRTVLQQSVEAPTVT